MDNWDLDDNVLAQYIDRFYGHGDYQAKYWFIGMEFGGGTSVTEIVGRIQGWYDRGGKELEDLGGYSHWFRESAPLQPTWSRLIRVVLSAEGQTPTKEDVRAYQLKRLGRAGGLDCILELLPLPSPGIGRWLFYPEYSRLSYLRDRETYTNKVAPLRAAHLRARIDEYHPEAVIFYGASYGYWWKSVAGVAFQRSSTGKWWMGESPHTQFIVMQHPVARGLNNDYFDSIGRFIASARTSREAGTR